MILISFIAGLCAGLFLFDNLVSRPLVRELHKSYQNKQAEQANEIETLRTNLQAAKLVVADHHGSFR